jgi:hypothetical protein
VDHLKYNKLELSIMKRLLLIGSLVFGFGASAQEINGGPVNVQGDVIDGVYIKEHIPTKRMIPYEFVREADVVWSKRVWRVSMLEILAVGLYGRSYVITLCWVILKCILHTIHISSICSMVINLSIQLCLSLVLIMQLIRFSVKKLFIT